MKPSQKMAELNIQLPSIAAPVGSYVPALKSGSFVYTSGQLPFSDGKLLHNGRVGANVSLEQAAQAARQAGLNALSAAAQAAGGIDHIRRLIKVTVYVGSDPAFTDQPKVANGASDLFAQILGDAGRHARAAIGVAALPLGACVEIDLVAEVD
ncbi:MAG: RidA family protein [Phycisphaerae bacterium]|nr:RidA family protein [Phycisphaerae bacterium]